MLLFPFQWPPLSIYAIHVRMLLLLVATCTLLHRTLLHHPRNHRPRPLRHHHLTLHFQHHLHQRYHHPHHQPTVQCLHREQRPSHSRHRQVRRRRQHYLSISPKLIRLRHPLLKTQIHRHHEIVTFHRGHHPYC